MRTTELLTDSYKISLYHLYYSEDNTKEDLRVITTHMYMINMVTVQVQCYTGIQYNDMCAGKPQ